MPRRKKISKEQLQKKIAARRTSGASAQGGGEAEVPEAGGENQQQTSSMFGWSIKALYSLVQLFFTGTPQESKPEQSEPVGGIVIKAGRLVMDGEISGKVKIVSGDIRIGRDAKFDSEYIQIEAVKVKNESEITAQKLRVVTDQLSGKGSMKATEAGIVAAYVIDKKQKLKGKIVYGGDAAEKLREFLKSTPKDLTEIQQINANIYADFLAYEYNKNNLDAIKCISSLEKSLKECDDSIIRKFLDDAYNIRFLNLVEVRKYSDAGHILEKMDIAQKAIYKPILESIIKAGEKKKPFKKKKLKAIQTEDIRELTSEEIAKREEEAEAARKRSEELEAWQAKVKAEKELKEALELEASMQAEAETQERMSRVKESKAKSKAAREAAKENFPDNIGAFVVAVENGEIGLDNLPPMLSQSYFCYKRQEIENKNPLSVLSSTIKWQIEEKEVYTYFPESQDSNVYKIHSLPNYYAAISEDLGEVNPEFKVALEHGRLSKGGSAAKSHSTSGLKVFDNVIELKIKGACGDTRLYTDTIYDDGNGNKLVLLDRFGKHSELERFHKAGASTKLIKLLSYQAQEAECGAAAAEPVDYAQEFYLKALAGLSGFDFGSEM